MKHPDNKRYYKGFSSVLTLVSDRVKKMLSTQEGTNKLINMIKEERNMNKIKLDHLEKVRKNRIQNEKKCLHDNCAECKGTGLKLNGQPCIHMISCPCAKCSPFYF